MKSKKMDRPLRILQCCILGIVALTLGAPQAFGARLSPTSKDYCAGPYDCIGMVIDSGDPILIQMGKEMSAMVTDQDAGTMVNPTEGPIANVRKMLSRANAGLSVVPSDMLKYLERSDVPVMRHAQRYLRFIMTIGRKVVHVVARADIQRLADLNGKRVVVGPDNTAMWVVSNNLLHLHGVTPGQRLQLKPIDGLTAVLVGQADAVFLLGNTPHPLLERLKVIRQTKAFGQYADQLHLLALHVPPTATEYQPVTVQYPGFAEHVETVAILPTLVSYDFSLKSTPYFRRRCQQLAKIGSMVRHRLGKLRQTGHQQWQNTTWELEAGQWQKDPCFFGVDEKTGVSAAIGTMLATPTVTAPTSTQRTSQPQTPPIPHDSAVSIPRNIVNATPPAPSPTTAPRPAPVLAALPPTTQLQLKLAGTVVGGNKQRYAVIEDLQHPGAQTLYQVGDMIQQAQIVEVRSRCMVLDKNGTRESLCFKDHPDNADASQPRAQEASLSPSPGREETQDEIARLDTSTWRVSRDTLLEFADTATVSKMAQAQPFMVQGRSQGFRLTRIQREGLLPKIGLQNDDVLQKVNGLSVTTHEDALKAYEQLQQAETVRVEILRNNRPTTLTYEIR